MKIVDPCGCFPTGRHYPGIAHLIRVRAVGVADELEPDGAWIDYPIAFIDTETTGMDPKVDRIIEIGVVLGAEGEVKDKHSWLLNPEVPIPQESSEVHGITDEVVADKPRFGEVAAEIITVLRGALPAAYNALFDQGFLHAELERCGFLEPVMPPAARADVTWLDPLIFARHLFKGKGESRALGAVAERLGIALVNAHRATDDAEAALRILYAIGDDPRVPKGYAALVQEQRRLARLQDEATKFWRK